MKFYFAGNVAQEHIGNYISWQYDLVVDLGAVTQWANETGPDLIEEDDLIEQLTLTGEIFSHHDYVGPFPVNWNELTQAELRVRGIQAADVVFGWLDDVADPWIRTEIGYAYGIGKQILVSGPGCNSAPLELHFATLAPYVTTPVKALRMFLSLPDYDAVCVVDGYTLHPMEIDSWCYAEAPGYIYILKAGPYYKIGRTKDLSSRIPTLKIQLPFTAQLVYAWATPHMVRVETHLHERFKAYRANGEWFLLPDEVYAELTGVPRCPRIPDFTGCGFTAPVTKRQR